MFFDQQTSKAMTLWRGVFTKLEYLILNHHTRGHACDGDKTERATKPCFFLPPALRTDSDFRLAPENQIIPGWRRKSDITRNLKI
jgi:hypothetical protein